MHVRDIHFFDFHDSIFQRFRPGCHLVQTDARRRLHVDPEFPGIVNRLQLCTHEGQQEQIEYKSGQRSRHDFFRMIDGKGHQFIVKTANILKPIVKFVHYRINKSRAIVPVFSWFLQPVGRHHRRQGVSGNRGKSQRKSNRQAELLKELPDSLTHAADGNKHCHQGHGRGQNGQHQFLGSVSGSQEGSLPHFHVAENIFNQYDSIVNQKTNGQRQAHQGHIVQGKTHNIHQEKCSDNRSRNGKAADNGSPQVPQEQISDEKGQETAEQNGVPHVRHVLPDVPALVTDNFHMDIRRHVLGHHLCQFLVHRVDDLYRIGTALLAHRHHNGWNAVGTGKGFRVFPAVFQVRHIRQADSLPVLVGHNDLLEIINGIQFPNGADRNGIAVVPHLAAGSIDIGAVHFCQHRLERNAVLAQLVRFYMDLDGPVRGTVNGNVGHAFQHLQPVDQYVIDDTADLAGAPFIRRKTVRHNGLGSHIKPLHYRLIDIIRQTAAHTRHLFTDLTGHLAGIRANFKFQHGLGIAFPNRRCDCLNAGNLADPAFNGFGNQGFHFLRRRAFIGYGNAYHGQVHVRVQVYAQPRIGTDTENDQHQNEHGCKNRSFYKCFNHSFAKPFSETFTSAPSRTLFSPPVMT